MVKNKAKKTAPKKAVAKKAPKMTKEQRKRSEAARKAWVTRRLNNA